MERGEDVLDCASVGTWARRWAIHTSSGRSCASGPMARHTTFEELLWGDQRSIRTRLAHGDHATARLASKPAKTSHATPIGRAQVASWVLSGADPVAAAELTGEPGFQGLGGGRLGRVRDC